MKNLTCLTLVVISCILISFNEDEKPKYSKNIKELLKIVDDEFVFVPSGSTILDDKPISIQSFFMSKGEVTNKQYRLFLADLKSNGETEKWQKAQVDSAKWTIDFKNEAFMKSYFNHTAYDNYPVVNITKEGAEIYCEWLTKRIRIKTGKDQLIVRLPLRAEFVRAAKGSDETNPYAWNGPYIRNEKGMMRCNHLQTENFFITRDEQTNELKLIQTDLKTKSSQASTDVTAPSISYWPSEFGLHNLNGNVSELTKEGLSVGGDWQSPEYDVRNESSRTYIGARPWIGFRPVFTYTE